MKLDFTKNVPDLNGNPMYPNKEDQDAGKPMTFKDTAISALLLPHQSDNDEGGDAKAKRFLLAVLIDKDPANADLKAEDVVMLKRLIGRTFAPLVVGRAFEFLDE